jgi:hypothetical protein
MRRRKPDLLIILIILVGLGVMLTGYTQDRMVSSPARTQISYSLTYIH